MHDLTRDLAGFHRRVDPPELDVEIELVSDDPDGQALTADWILFGGELSDGRIEQPYELTPSMAIALRQATTDALIS